MGSIERTPNKRWRARYRDLSGRSRSKTFDRKLDAAKFLERVGADLQPGEWAEAWYQTTAPLKPTARVSYGKILDRRVLPRWGDRPLGSIDRAEVRQWVAEMTDEGLSPKWIRNVVSVFALVLELARDAGAIRDNPARRIRLPRPARSEAHFLTAEEVARLADAMRDEYRFFVVLAAYTGMRPGELCGLRVKRLDLLRRRVSVAETLRPVNRVLVSGPPKSYEVRSVAVPRFVAAAAGEALLAARAEPARRCSSSSGPTPRPSKSAWATATSA